MISLRKRSENSSAAGFVDLQGIESVKKIGPVLCTSLPFANVNMMPAP
jgi:hypothetical protein